MSKIIGIGGRKRAGKDSVCDLLVYKFGYTKIAFADNIREMCAQAFSLKLKDFIDDNLKEKPFEHDVFFQIKTQHSLEQWIYTRHKHILGFDDIQQLYDKTKAWQGYNGFKFKCPRHILQIVGTELIRDKILASYHADVVFDNIKNNPDKRYCISDCRFSNERALVKENGGATLLVQSDTDDYSCTHASEMAVGNSDDYDYTFHNKKQGLDLLALNFSDMYNTVFRDAGKFTKADHIQAHVEAHRSLDALMADYINETGNLLSGISIMQLIDWSYQQTLNPSDVNNTETK